MLDMPTSRVISTESGQTAQFQLRHSHAVCATAADHRTTTSSSHGYGSSSTVIIDGQING